MSTYPDANRPQQPGGPDPVPQHAPGTDLGTDLSATFRWMWTAFTKNVAAFLVPGIVYGIIVLAFVGAGMAVYFALLFSGVDTSSTYPTEVSPGRFLGAMAAALGASLLGGIVSYLWSSGAMRAARIVADGSRSTIGQAFIGTGNVVLTALLVGVLTAIGSALCYVPGVLVAFFCMWAAPAAARGAGPIEAIKESARLARANVGTSIVTLLIIGVGASIGSSFIIPLVVMPALTALTLTGMYERLNRRELTEPTTATAS